MCILIYYHYLFVISMIMALYQCCDKFYDDRVFKYKCQNRLSCFNNALRYFLKACGPFLIIFIIGILVSSMFRSIRSLLSLKSRNSPQLEVDLLIVVVFSLFFHASSLNEE